MKNEDFTCDNCSKEITKHPSGSARNHCPFCLYSKHLDKDFPWDRLSECHSVMQPVWIDYKKNKGDMIKRQQNYYKENNLDKLYFCTVNGGKYNG